MDFNHDKKTMNNTTALILESLHVLVSENVIGEKQYTSRYKGFIGELAFSEWLNRNPVNGPTAVGFPNNRLSR